MVIKMIVMTTVVTNTFLLVLLPIISTTNYSSVNDSNYNANNTPEDGSNDDDLRTRGDGRWRGGGRLATGPLPPSPSLDTAALLQIGLGCVSDKLQQGQ